MNEFDDKRISQRVPQDTPILFSSNPGEGRGANPREQHNATMIDISATGMGIFTTTRIATGQLVDFIKDQPHWELPAQALVVWSLKHGAGFRAGLEFVIDPFPRK